MNKVAKITGAVLVCLALLIFAVWIFLPLSYIFVVLFSKAPPSKDPHIGITENSPRIPIFDFSQLTKMHPGYSLIRIEKTQYRDRGVETELVWEIQHVSNKAADKNLNTLIYNRVPQGWVQTQPARPIEDLNLYSFNQVVLFRRNYTGHYDVVPSNKIDELPSTASN
jgi:hypothetical protein